MERFNSYIKRWRSLVLLLPNSYLMKILKKNSLEPYKLFYKYFNQALKANQPSYDAIAISSYDFLKKEISSRYVNLKYIDDKKWIFFSNYSSKKALDFDSHSQISALIYWNKIDIQIRMKAKINKTSKKFSDEHFNKRNFEKNVLAVSSSQSKLTSSYEDVLQKYENNLNNLKKPLKRPDYWGGYVFVPYYFEFWKGHMSRLNKREVFEKIDDVWTRSFLQP